MQEDSEGEDDDDRKSRKSKLGLSETKIWIKIFPISLTGQYQGLPSNHPAMKKAKLSVPKHKKGPKIELKRPEQVLKQRKVADKKKQKNSRGKKGKGRKR